MGTLPFQIDCFVCQYPVYFAYQIPDSPLEAACSHCFYKYGLLYGELKNFSTHITNKGKRNQATICKLTIALSSKLLHEVKFTIALESNSFSIASSDKLSIFYTLRNNEIEDVLLVRNHTTGRDCNVVSPGNKAKALGIMSGSGIFAAGWLLTSYLTGPLAFIPLVVAIPTAGYTGFSLFKRRAPKVHDDLSKARLIGEQKLLGELHRVQQRLEEISSEYQNIQNSIDTQELVKSKMLKSDSSTLYQKRIESRIHNINILKQCLLQSQSLKKLYTVLLEMLEIEYHDYSSPVLEVDNFSILIQSQREEIAKLESQVYELKLLIDPTRLLDHDRDSFFKEHVDKLASINDSDSNFK